MDVDKLVQACNFVTASVSLIVAILLVKYVLKSWTKIDIYAVPYIGMAVCLFGLTLHRLWWWLWRVARIQGNPHADFFVDNAWFTLFAFFLMWSGAIMVIAPLCQTAFGRYWFLVCKSAVLVLLSITYLVA